MPGFTVDATGFSVPRYNDARARLVELWREEFGPNTDTSPASPDGQIITICALLLTLAWQGVGASINNSALRTSEGGFVDLILDLFARRRLDAEASTASLVWYGTDTTVVPLGSLAATGSGESRFATDAAATIGDGDVCFVVRIDDVEDTTLYRVVVNGTNCDYTSDGSATMDEIAAGVLAAIQAEDFTAAAAGEDEFGRARIVVELDTAGTVTEPGAVMTVHTAVRVEATCTETGAVVLLAGTPTVANAIAGVLGVTSTADAEVGRARETDADFKARHYRTLSSNGARSSDAIAARLLEVDGVTQARVFENEGPVEDEDGRPPHSFEPVVLGGDDQDLAEVLLAQKPGGIRCFGRTTTVDMPVRGGTGTVEIGITRPTTLYAHIEVTITPGEGYPTAGTPLDTIRDALALYLTTGAGAPLMGADLYRVTLYGVITAAVPGILGIAIRTDTTPAPLDAPTFAAADIVVDDLEILDHDSSRITVL